MGGPESAVLQKIVAPSSVLLLPVASKLECVLCKKGFSGQNVIKAGRRVRSTQRHPDKTTDVSDLHRGTLTKPQVADTHWNGGTRRRGQQLGHSERMGTLGLVRSLLHTFNMDEKMTDT